ncbi:MAG: hypothetical protein J2P25_08135 [Nocardiopsaceae bacterium]|nr:hypothetical protein [Nocardiopsaceae bacterium]
MIRIWGTTRARAGSAVLACVAAGLIALTGCSSGNSSSSLFGNTPGGGSTSGGGGSTPGGGGFTGGASPGGSTSTPSWAAALGSGVTIDPPGTTTPSTDSPGGVYAAEVEAENTKDPALFCPYTYPPTQSKCESTLSSISQSQLAQLGKYEDFKASYAAIDGTKAIVGFTGTDCQPNETPQCVTNTDPAKLLDSGKTFTELWTQAGQQVGQNSTTNTYELLPCIEIQGKWYAAIEFS